MQKLYPKSLVISYLSLVIFLTTLLSPLFAFAAYNKPNAQTYLSAHANSAWAIMGLAALSQNPDAEFLKSFSGTSANDYATPILALTSLSLDPRTYPAVDFVAKLKTFHTQNQIGDASTVNDDIFGILALISAGEPLSDPSITDAKNFIIQNQKPNGGWGFAVSAGTDSNITAAAIVALKAAGVPATDEKITKALDYLKTAQNNDGGFTYDPTSEWGTDSDSSSTAWVLWALNALGISESTWAKGGKNPSDYLASTQAQAGHFEYQAGAGTNSLTPANTAWAVIALEGKTLPLKTITPVQKQYAFRIEGSADTICEGKTAGPTALDIVKNAAGLCGFTYHIKDTSFGPYLDKISGDEAAGTAGWQYWVDYNSPSVGAADYQLEDGDEVLWAFGNFDILPTKLSLSPTETGSGASSQATVEYMDGTLKPLGSAKVLVGASEFTTSSDGKTSVSGADGYYKVFAKKDGFVRSNKVLLKIGNPSSSSVNLSVNVLSGSVNGTSTGPSTLSFTIEPSSLDFGSLAKGQTGKKTLKLKNSGSSNLQFESEVTSGQPAPTCPDPCVGTAASGLFKDNLKLDSKIWKQFKKDVSAGQNQDVEASLTVPSSAPAGAQTGTLIFWAQ